VTLESPELKAALGRLAARRLRQEPHLGAAELEAFHWGDLDAEREPAVREHLAVCSECVALLRALDGFAPALAPDGGGVTAAEVEAALAATLAQVRPDPVAAARTPARSVALRSRWRGPQPLAAAALAALLAAGIGLGLGSWAASRRAAGFAARAGSLERELARTRASRQRMASDLDRSRRELSAAHDKLAENDKLAGAWLRPHVNTVVEQLRAGPSRGPAAAGAARVRLPAGTDLLTLILEDPQDQRFSGYRLELRGPRGEVIGDATGLERTPFRNFVVTLPGKTLISGRLAITLYGVGDGVEKRLGVYEIEIVR
jgi:hypothetical protein